MGNKSSRDGATQLSDSDTPIGRVAATNDAHSSATTTYPTFPTNTASSSTSAAASSTSAPSIPSTAISANAACTYCGMSSSEPVYHKNGQYCTCKRCGGLLPYATQQKRRTAGNQSDVASIQLPLQRLHILPFQETLPQNLQTYASEDDLQQQYTKPFFAANHPYLQVGDRLQIEGVDFKVVAAHPPAGVVTQNTQVRLMGKPLSALSNVTRLHVLPTRASLNALPSSERNPNPTQLFTSYIRPHFGNEHESHHVALGDTFMSRGVQFKVVACTPNNGIVGAQSEIFTDGLPLPDINKLHILPVFESLPNNEKNITPEQSFERYLAPFFLGRMQYVNKRDRVEIDGVQFKVIGIDPAEPGIVTLDTEIFATGNPLRSEDIRRQQEVEDEQMARQLAAEQDAAMGFGGRSGGRRHRGGGEGLVLPLGGSPEDLRMRMTEILRVMPQNDPYRPVVQRLHDQLLIMPYLPPGVGNQGLERSMMQLMQSARAVQAPPDNGASQGQLDNLPTRTFKKKPGEAVSEEDKEHLTCMVCLCEYEDGDELRTLPCFHSFHSQCIDMWLRRKSACPVCRHKLNGTN